MTTRLPCRAPLPIRSGKFLGRLDSVASLIAPDVAGAADRSAMMSDLRYLRGHAFLLPTGPCVPSAVVGVGMRQPQDGLYFCCAPSSGSMPGCLLADCGVNLHGPAAASRETVRCFPACFQRASPLCVNCVPIVCLCGRTPSTRGLAAMRCLRGSQCGEGRYCLCWPRVSSCWECCPSWILPPSLLGLSCWTGGGCSLRCSDLSSWPVEGCACPSYSAARLHRENLSKAQCCCGTHPLLDGA